MYRALEKTAFRCDDDRWSADCVLDVVRGALLYDDLEGFCRALDAIQNYEGVEVLRIKDRFSHPTSGGWRDCMLNLVFLDDPNKHVCEVQYSEIIVALTLFGAF